MKRFLLLMLLAATASADCDIPAVVAGLRPGATFTMNGRTYAGLVWQDVVQTKPTQTEVDAACLDVNAQAKQAVAGAKTALASTDPGEVQVRLLRAAVLVLIDEINTLRALHSLAARTPAQAKTAIANKLDSGAAN